MTKEKMSLSTTDELQIRMQATEMAIGIVLKRIGLAAGIDMGACLEEAMREADDLNPKNEVSERVPDIIYQFAEQVAVSKAKG